MKKEDQFVERDTGIFFILFPPNESTKLKKVIGSRAKQQKEAEKSKWENHSSGTIAKITTFFSIFLLCVCFLCVVAKKIHEKK